jgi:hypothetical protein
LGPSGITVFHNLKKPAALLSSAIICSYFLTMAVLQMTTPLLFTLTLVNVTRSLSSDTIVGTPLLFDLSGASTSLAEVPGAQVVNAAPDWFTASTVVNLLGSNISLSPPGLQGNRIYDTFLTPLYANGTGPVGYTDFHVRCGMISQPNVTWTVGNATQPTSGRHTYLPVTFSAAATINGITFNISDMLVYDLNSTEPASSYWIPSGKSRL